jgi:hypothetical protein
MNFRDYIVEDLRLVLLLLLKEAGGSANESVLQGGAASVGHPRASRTEIRTQLEWLRERGLVTHQWYDQKLLVASLTERGLDTADGREHVEGVKKPSIVRGS